MFVEILINFIILIRLRDESVEVRKTAVTILTHLILNDMLKVKGQISEMAVCLEDKEEKIAKSAKMLFSELARKVIKRF